MTAKHRKPLFERLKQGLEEGLERMFANGDHRPLSPQPGLCGRRVISSPAVVTAGYFRDVPGGTKCKTQIE